MSVESVDSEFVSCIAEHCSACFNQSIANCVSCFDNQNKLGTVHGSSCRVFFLTRPMSKNKKWSTLKMTHTHTSTRILALTGVVKRLNFPLE
jgi:hypothetical protein